MRIFIILICASLFWSCGQNKPDSSVDGQKNTPQLISTKDNTASGPFFTDDQNGSPVIVWTEKLPGEETGNIVKFAKWNTSNGDFDAAIKIAPSAGCRAHDESMSKVAFKEDGTIVAVFSKRTPSKKNRFAGALYYTQSFDDGKAWTDARYLHVGDTTMGLSRSFFDIATLPDGEVGAIWLDSRLTKKRGEGSSIFFAKTNEKDGFVEDKPIGFNTCECCRTELFVASNGDIHAMYRDILQDSIRDMSLLVSTDNGETFSQPRAVSSDNWVINGCPHTGPSFAETQDGLHCTWFSMGGGQGIYYAKSADGGNRFAPRKLLTSKGKHPQVLTTKSNKVVFLWEENPDSQSSMHSGHSESHDKPSDTSPAYTSHIKAQVWQNENPIREHWVSAPEAYAEYPVAADLEDDRVVIAWVQEVEEDIYGVYFREIEI